MNINLKNGSAAHGFDASPISQKWRKTGPIDPATLEAAFDEKEPIRANFIGQRQAKQNQSSAHQKNAGSSSSTEYSSPNISPFGITQGSEKAAFVAPMSPEMTAIDKKHHLVDKWNFEIPHDQKLPQEKHSLGRGVYGETYSVNMNGQPVIAKVFHENDGSFEYEFLGNLTMRRFAQEAIVNVRDIFYFKCLKYLVPCYSSIEGIDISASPADILDQLGQIIDKNNLPPLYFQKAEGMTLQKFMQNGHYGRPLDKVKRLKHFCMAMAFLDEAGIVHNDIKVDNIMVFEKKAVPIDFGISSYSENISLLGYPPLINLCCASPEAIELLNKQEEIQERIKQEEKNIEEAENVPFTSSIKDFFSSVETKEKNQKEREERANQIITEANRKITEAEQELEDMKQKWERVLGPEGGPKCNAYGIGAVAFAFLFGTAGEVNFMSPCFYHPKYKAKDIPNLAAQWFDRLNNDPHQPYPYAPQQSEILKEVVCGLLHPDPAERWTAKDAVDALKVVINDMKQEQQQQEFERHLRKRFKRRHK